MHRVFEKCAIRKKCGYRQLWLYPASTIETIPEKFNNWRIRTEYRRDRGRQVRSPIIFHEHRNDVFIPRFGIFTCVAYHRHRSGRSIPEMKQAKVRVWKIAFLEDASERPEFIKLFVQRHRCSIEECSASFILLLFSQAELLLDLGNRHRLLALVSLARLAETSDVVCIL
jgi:hypothetical protein